MGIPAARIKEVPHGLLCHAKSRPAKVSYSQSESCGICRLLFFGSIKPYKGLDILIKALSLIPRSARQKVRLRVAGNPDLEIGKILQLATDCGVDQLIDWQLRFFGDDEIERLFEDSDVVVFPYKKIDASGALMTTLPYRKAIIASQVGQFGELLKDRESAILVRPEDPEELAKAITEYVCDPELQLRLRSGIANVLRSIPPWDDIAEKTADFYRRLRVA
jgi:glycosyltransferase involved in cell wall biosynthesis